jgi:hypothetical protein
MEINETRVKLQLTFPLRPPSEHRKGEKLGREEEIEGRTGVGRRREGIAEEGDVKVNAKSMEIAEQFIQKKSADGKEKWESGQQEEGSNRHMFRG